MLILSQKCQRDDPVLVSEFIAAKIKCDAGESVSEEKEAKHTVTASYRHNVFDANNQIVVVKKSDEKIPILLFDLTAPPNACCDSDSSGYRSV